jgi:hypothetical protein
MRFRHDHHDSVIAHRAGAATAALPARHRPAAATARDWIDILSARAQQRCIRRDRHRAALASGAVIW